MGEKAEEALTYRQLGKVVINDSFAALQTFTIRPRLSVLGRRTKPLPR